jgi:hypothetical protein
MFYAQKTKPQPLQNENFNRIFLHEQELEKIISPVYGEGNTCIPQKKERDCVY